MMFMGLGARGVSPNPFCFGIICAGPAEQLSTRGHTYVDNVRFTMLMMTCLLLNAEFAGKMDWAIEWIVKAWIQRDA